MYSHFSAPNTWSLQPDVGPVGPAGPSAHPQMAGAVAQLQQWQLQQQQKEMLRDQQIQQLLQQQQIVLAVASTGRQVAAWYCRQWRSSCTQEGAVVDCVGTLIAEQ